MKQLTILLVSLFGMLPILKAQTTIEGDSLQEVVVTGTGTHHLLRTAPVQTEVITRRDLEQYGGRSIEEILSGLSASFAFSEDDMGSQMQMNGLGNAYILVLVDGKRLHGDNGGENDLGQINPARIERIEIVKGAASALYGSDAIAGVINIITRKQESSLQLENDTRGGSYGDLRQHNAVGLTLGPVQSLTNFHYRRTDGWRNFTMEDPTRYGGRIITNTTNKTVSKNQLWQLSERLSVQPAKGMDVYAEGMLYHKHIYHPRGGDSEVAHYYDLSYDDAALAAGWSWNLRDAELTADVTWNRHAYFYDYTSLYGVIDESDPSPYAAIYFDGDRVLQSDQRRTMAQLKGVFTLPRQNRLSVGYDYRYDWLKAPNRVAGGRATDWTQALYVQDEWSPLDHVNITAGLRLDDNQQFGLHLTPKVSAMWSLGDVTLRTSWAQGFKSPTPKELHYRYMSTMAGLCLGNTGLKPQTSNYFMLSAEYRTSRFTASLTGYYNKVDRMISLVSIPLSQAPGDMIIQYNPQLVQQYKNLEDAYTTGLDLNVKWNAGREVVLGGSYSLLQARGSVYNEETEQLDRITINGTAHHKGSLYATWTHRFSRDYRLGIGLYGRASTTRYYQKHGDGKGYQLWRLSTTHDIGHGKTLTWRAEAGVDNIFNYVDDTPHGRHLGITTPGTTVYASLVVRFNHGKKVSYSKHYSNLKTDRNEED
jgi:outer membrane receptor for ferrienterochelin and colicins